MELTHSKSNTGGKEGLPTSENSNYNIRPTFKDKFRPAEAKAIIDQLIPDVVLKHTSILAKDSVSASDPK